jgi:RNA polymerase sigma factor (sigma-70 family)
MRRGRRRDPSLPAFALATSRPATRGDTLCGPRCTYRTMTEENSADLVRGSKHDPQLFALFYRSQFYRVLAFMTRRVWDAEVALDLTAESFAQAYAARQRFRGRTPQEAEAWIFRIARRQLARYLRRGRLERRALTRLGIEVPHLDAERRERIEELAGLDSVRALLRRELEGLSTAQREALQLRIVDELSYAEVARHLEISEQAARLRVSRGLRALASALEGNPTLKELRA